MEASCDSSAEGRVAVGSPSIAQICMSSIHRTELEGGGGRTNACGKLVRACGAEVLGERGLTLGEMVAGSGLDPCLTP